MVLLCSACATGTITAAEQYEKATSFLLKSPPDNAWAGASVSPSAVSGGKITRSAPNVDYPEFIDDARPVQQAGPHCQRARRIPLLPEVVSTAPAIDYAYACLGDTDPIAR
jgi:hypothetical protein